MLRVVFKLRCLLISVQCISYTRFLCTKRTNLYYEGIKTQHNMFWFCINTDVTLSYHKKFLIITIIISSRIHVLTVCMSNTLLLWKFRIVLHVFATKLPPQTRTSVEDLCDLGERRGDGWPRASLKSPLKLLFRAPFRTEILPLYNRLDTLAVDSWHNMGNVSSHGPRTLKTFCLTMGFVRSLNFSSTFKLKLNTGMDRRHASLVAFVVMPTEKEVPTKTMCIRIIKN